MKTRIGFVSNSSSSSFLIYGVQVDKGFLKERFNSKTTNAVLEDWEVATNGAISSYDPYDNGLLYIGSSLDKIGLDETRSQFQERIGAF